MRSIITWMLADAADQGFEAGWNVRQAVVSRVDEIGRTPWHFRYRRFVTLAVLPPASETLWVAAGRCRAMQEAADAAIGVELFRRATSRLPRKLDELVPTFLPAVPLDPFDRQPLRYQVRNDHVVIYSVSYNGQDDGGDFAADPTEDEILWLPYRDKGK